MQGAAGSGDGGGGGSGPVEWLPAAKLMLPLPEGCEDLLPDLLQGGTRIVHEVSGQPRHRLMRVVHR